MSSDYLTERTIRRHIEEKEFVVALEAPHDIFTVP
jgi:hypothetical protein